MNIDVSIAPYTEDNSSGILSQSTISVDRRDKHNATICPAPQTVGDDQIRTKVALEEQDGISVAHSATTIALYNGMMNFDSDAC